MQGGVLVVEGSRAGLLATQNISSSHRFNPPFLIKCASDDILSLKIAKSIQAYETGNHFAQGTLHGPVLTKRYKTELIGPASSTFDANQNNTPTNVTASGFRSSSKIIQPLPTRASIGQNALIRTFTIIQMKLICMVPIKPMLVLSGAQLLLIESVTLKESFALLLKNKH